MAYTEFFVWNNTDKGSSSDNNGGGPLSAIVGATGAPIYTTADSTSNADGTTITDNVAQWTNASVGDWVCFDPGVSDDFARITNLTAAVATVTPAVTASQASKTTNVGGAWATVQRAANIMTTAFVNAAGNPPRANILNSVTAFAEDIDSMQVGTISLYLTFQGYTTTAGDGGMAEIDGDGLSNHNGTWDTNGKSYLILRDLYIHGDQAGIEGVYGYGSHNCLYHRLKVKATGAGADAVRVTTSNDTQVDDCWVTDAAAIGINANYTVEVSNCRVDSAGTVGIKFAGANRSGTIKGCVVNDAGDEGIYVTDRVGSVEANSVYNSGDSGIRVNAIVGVGVIKNNILVNNGQVSGSGYGIEITTLSIPLLMNNAYYNNKDGQVNGVILERIGEVTLTGDPFVDAAGNDFRLDNTAGQGAACRGAGFPGSPIWSS